MKKLTREQRIAAADIEVRKNIEEHGCHVYSVFDPIGKYPEFSYSVGIQESCGAPEAIVIGLRSEMGHFLVNQYNQRVQKGKRFEPGKKYRGFLKGFTVYVEPFRASRAKDYMLGDHRLYDGWKFKAVQIVWPSTAGAWPWDPEASEWFRNNQPLLCKQPGVAKKKSLTDQTRTAKRK